MTVLSKSETVDVSNPKLSFYNQILGVLTDIEDGDGTLEYQIFRQNQSDDATEFESQIFPVTVGDRASVDLTNDRVSQGIYAATFTSGNQKIDDVKHRIQWFWKQTVDDTEKTASQFFEVVDQVFGYGSRYVLEADLRAQGVAQAISSVRIQQAIILASQMIEKITGRFFEPRVADWSIDGAGKPMLLLENPIIGVSRIVMGDDPKDTDEGVDLENVKIYNRHLSQNMPSRDDRENPKISFIHHDDTAHYSGEGAHRHSGYHTHGLHHSIHGHGFHFGQQNVTVFGVFGFTEYDGTPWGATPLLLQRAAALMALRELTPLTDADCRAQEREAWRITEERTRDQTVKYDTPRSFGGPGGSGWTGDPEIDQLLSMFIRPPIMGAA